MGKTHRNVYAQSDSESLYGSPHNRGFAKIKKRHSHHSIRNKNRNADEETIQNTCKHWKVNHYSGRYTPKSIDKIGNIPNLPSFTLDNTIENVGGGSHNGISSKWAKEDGNVKETINKVADTIESLNVGGAYYVNYQQRYLNATKKQIERRGKMSSFTNHRTYSTI
jgi:hypothetical protein